MGRGIRGRLRVPTPSSVATSGGVLLFAAFGVVNASNFLFRLAVSRTLRPSDYGALRAPLGLVLVLTVPASSLPVVITKEVASRHGPAAQTAIPVVIGALLAESVIWGVVGCVPSPLLKPFLHLPSLSSAAMLAALMVPMVIALVSRAVLLGEMRFRRLASGLLAGAATRLGPGIALSAVAQGSRTQWGRRSYCWGWGHPPDSCWHHSSLSSDFYKPGRSAMQQASPPVQSWISRRSGEFTRWAFNSSFVCLSPERARDTDGSKAGLRGAVCFSS